MEAYSCGTPVVTFSDLDASNDVYNDDCCIFAENRSDESLANAICNALRRDWDKEKIKKFSLEFSIDRIALKYNKALLSSHKKWDEKVIEERIENVLSPR